MLILSDRQLNVKSELPGRRILLQTQRKRNTAFSRIAGRPIFTHTAIFIYSYSFGKGQFQSASSYSIISYDLI